MNAAITETERRRATQQEYNEEHGITPKTIIKDIRDLISITSVVEGDEEGASGLENIAKMTREQRLELIDGMEVEMRVAAKELNFEKAANLRDLILEITAQYKLKK
jgi:excinuclease ABC subunit B